MAEGVHPISVLCVYFLVAVCILAAPFLKNDLPQEFADKNVCGGASCWLCIGAKVEYEYDTAMWRCHSDSNPCLVVDPGESSGFKKYRGGGSKTFFWKMH